MKKVFIHVSVLIVVFIVAVFFFGMVTSKQNADMTADLESATLPVLSFSIGDLAINPLKGYVSEMDISSMRDTITPIRNGQLKLNLFAAENQVESLEYALFSMNGSRELFSGTVEGIQETMNLTFPAEVDIEKESILKITLQLEDEKKVYYYNRVIADTELDLNESIKYVDKFFMRVRDSVAAVEVIGALEPSAEADNSSYGRVNIHSDVSMVTWGSLQPEVISDVQWEIKEANGTYISFLLSYEVQCKGDLNEHESYKVKEFYRVRMANGKMYLLDYDRTMTQILEYEKKVLDEFGIVLGITKESVEYKTNLDGTKVSFVQDRTLYHYDKAEDSLAMVFSFSKAENQDIRNLFPDHEITIASVAADGSTTFLVSGYMNRDVHEGEVGVAIYYFDSIKNGVEEIAFIPSDQAPDRLIQAPGRVMYYNTERNALYVVRGSALYKMDLIAGSNEAVVTGLEENSFVGSKDGEAIAYQNDKNGVTVLHLSSGESYDVVAEQGSYVRPLGFINEDFVYGIVKDADMGVSVSGEGMNPMEKLLICNARGEVLSGYEQPDVYLSDVSIEEKMIVINRVSRKDNVYTAIEPDYVNSNEEVTGTNIFPEKFSTELKKSQIRLRYVDGIQDQTPKILMPKQMISDRFKVIDFEETTEQKLYYVYGAGRLLSVFDKAGSAISEANKQGAVAVSSDGYYLWEGISRTAAVELEEFIESISIVEGETPLSACQKAIGRYYEIDEKEVEKLKIDLTGSSLWDALYQTKKERPLVIMLANQEAVLVTGYDRNTVTYLKPGSANTETISIEEMEEAAKGSGNTYIAFFPPDN